MNYHNEGGLQNKTDQSCGFGNISVILSQVILLALRNLMTK
jgi:hypothetical protein